MPRDITVNSKGELSQRRIVKATDDTIQIKVDFGNFFDTDTASTQTVTGDSGITIAGAAVSSNVVSFTAAGGSNGSSYDVQVKLAGATETKEVLLQVLVYDPETSSINDYDFCH